MGTIVDDKPQGSYGIDAPRLLPLFGLLVVANLASGIVSSTLWPFLGAAALLTCGACGLHASRRGKFVVWSQLLRDLKLKGDEHILDLGCGRGAVLLLAARHLTTGLAVGVDIWNRGDQSSNSEQATRFNAAAEQVSDRGGTRSRPARRNSFSSARLEDRLEVGEANPVPVGESSCPWICRSLTRVPGIVALSAELQSWL